MVWPGTLIGVVAGFALASIPGAMLGALLGQVFDRRLQLESWGDLRARLRGDPAIEEQDLLFVLLGRLAKSDGRVQEAHIQQARLEMKRIGLDDVGARRAIAAFNRGKAGSDNLQPSLRVLKGESLDPRLAGVEFSELADSLRRQGIGGVSVSRIASSSRAYAGGLRNGDVIVAVNRRDLSGVNDFERLASSRPRQLMLTLLRGEEAFYLLL